MSEWKEYKIEDLAEFQNQKRVPLSSTERSARKGNYPYFGASGIVDYIDDYIFDGKFVLVSEDGENLRTRKTPIAFKANGKFWVNNHAHILKCNKDYLNDLIVYYFKNLDLNEFITGAVQPKLNKSSLASIPIFLPEDEVEQKAIAAVLSSLDNKIDLLQRQNKTLEAMAETLFRQWFIAEAQEDWDEKPLSSIANFLNGLACQKFPPTNSLEKLPVLKIKELSGGISENSDWATTDVKPEYIVENGDVIFAWSASLMVKVWNGERCVLNQHLFKVTSDQYPKWFYLMWCKQHLAEFVSISSSHATTMGHIKRSDLDKALVLIPSLDELKVMSEQMTPILNKKIALANQIRTLENLRDTLLPKLMSGEVRVKTSI